MTDQTKLTVETLFEDNKQGLAFELANSPAGIQKIIPEHDLCRPGLLLSGYEEAFAEKKIQVMGYTEQNYLNQLSKKDKASAFKRLMDEDIPCLVVTNGSKLDKELLNMADKHKICIILSPAPTIQIYQKLFAYLNDIAAPSTNIHGTLVDVYGVGILLTGKSGIGKSEIALDLVERGHRLVADDVVKIIRRSAGMLIGTSEKMLKNMLEIRGVGLIDVWSIFGIRAIRVQKRVEVVVNLEHADSIEKYDRLGIAKEYIEYLGVNVPIIHLPILPGKNITVLAEVIALKTMQNIYGIQPEHDFIKRLDEKIQKNSELRKYLSNDVE